MLPDPPPVTATATEAGIVLSDGTHELLVPWLSAGDLTGKLVGLIIAWQLKTSFEASLRGKAKPPTLT